MDEENTETELNPNLIVLMAEMIHLIEQRREVKMTIKRMNKKIYQLEHKIKTELKL